MKEIIKRIPLIVLEGVFVFVILFASNLAILTHKGFGLAGSEIIFQMLFTPESYDQLHEMDDVLKENYNFYDGYHYYDTTTTCNVNNKDKENILYVVGEGLNYNLHFRIIEGNYFDFKESYEMLPVIVGGKDYKKSEIGDVIDITIQTKLEDNYSLQTKGKIIGKVDSMSYRHPENISLEDRGIILHRGIVICPDAYIDQIFDLSNKDVILNITGRTSDSLNEMKDLALNYGVFSAKQNLVDSETFFFLNNSLINIYLITVVSLLSVLFINIFAMKILIGRKKSIMHFGIQKICSLLICIVLIFGYNSIGGNLYAYKLVGFTNIAIAIIYSLLAIGIFVILRKRANTTTTLIDKAGHKYEKI